MTIDVMPLFYNDVSGTSFPVAHVSGGMALLERLSSSDDKPAGNGGD